MIDALFNLALIFVIAAGVFTVGAAMVACLASATKHNRMATRIRAGRHYQGK